MTSYYYIQTKCNDWTNIFGPETSTEDKACNVLPEDILFSME